MSSNKGHIWINGELVRGSSPVLYADNRAFAYGDGLFELIHAYGTEGKHLPKHLNRMVNSMKILGMLPPPYLTLEFLSQEISRTLNKNRIYGSAKVKISLYRRSGSEYASTSEEVGMLIHTEALTHNFYPINSKGLVLDFYTQIRKPINILSPIKTCSALLNVMAANYAAKHQWDDCILINDQNRIVGTTSSNIFALKGTNLYTPPMSEGAVSGVMRSIILEMAPKLKLKVHGNEPIEPTQLFNMDEIFTTNAITGIQWVVGIRDKRFFGDTCRRISQALNRQTFPNQFNDGFSG